MVAQPQQWLKIYPDTLNFDGGYAETPHSAQVHVGGDIDIRWVGRIPFPSWDDQRHPLINKGDFVSGDNRAWEFACQASVSGTKKLQFRIDDVGLIVDSTVGLPVPAEDWVGVRVTWDSSTGDATFYYSTDFGATWTQLGAVRSLGTGTINNRGQIWIGQDRYSAFTAMAGQVLWAEVRNGINGTVVARPDFTENGPWSLGDDHDTNQAQVDPQGNTWTLKRTGNAYVRIVDRHFARTAYLPASEDSIETPHDAALEPSGDLHIRAIVRPNSWASGTSQALIGKGSSTSTNWTFSILSDGKLFFSLAAGSAATSSVAVPFSDGEWGIIGCDYQAAGGTVRFYAESLDDLDGPVGTFTDLGTSQSESPGGVPTNTDPIVIGRDPVFSGFGFIGHIAYVNLGHSLVSSDVLFPVFREGGPWQPGDNNATGARNDGFGVPWTLQGNTTIKEISDWPLDTRGGVKLGSDVLSVQDLEGEAIGGLVLGSNFSLDTRIVGQAEGKLVFGSTSDVAIALVGKGGLILKSRSEVIPPEITPGIGSAWSIGIAGRGYMLSTLDQEYPFEFRSYEIQAIPQQRPQIDDKDEPGEQTLFPWWSRAQHSWHEGAGQDIFDSPFSSRFKYCTSRGLDPWDEGELKFLKDTELLRTDTVDDHHLLATPDALFYTANGVLHRDTDPDTAGTDSLTDHSGTPINSIASDGEFLYAAFSGGSLGIKRTPLAGALAWSDVNVQTAVEKIAVVKGRLIGAKGGNLYEYDLSVTTEPEPLNPPMPSTWKWTGITESGPAIYFSGHAGDISEIFAVRLTAQDIPFSSVATLGAMRSIWQAPEGETVHTVRGFLGQQVLVGTSKGVRVGTIVTGDGDLEISGLITEQKEEHPQALNVKAFEPQGEFAWFTWSNYDATRSGLGRIHLGELNWSSDLMYPVLGEVTTVVDYQDRRYFVIDEGSGLDSHIIKEHATDLVATAKLEICTIRFGTREVKQLRHFDTNGEGSGTFSMNLGSDGGAEQPVVIASSIAGSKEHVINIQGTRFKATLNFTRDTDPTAQMKFKEWRLRSEPRSKGRFRYMVPLMIYDHVVNLADQEVGKIGYAFENLESLMELYRTGRDTLFHRLGSGVPGGPGPVLVIMEDLRFKTFTPPVGAKGFGGIALAILREVR